MSAKIGYGRCFDDLLQFTVQGSVVIGDVQFLQFGDLRQFLGEVRFVRAFFPGEKFFDVRQLGEVVGKDLFEEQQVSLELIGLGLAQVAAISGYPVAAGEIGLGQVILDRVVVFQVFEFTDGHRQILLVPLELVADLLGSFFLEAFEYLFPVGDVG